MTEEKNSRSGQRDRSPSYPIIPIGVALERLEAFEEHFKRSPARSGAVGGAWGIKANAYAGRTVAALKYYGLLDYEQSENGRQIVISDEGRTYLRAQQENIKQDVIRNAALRPPQIAKFWKMWGTERPADPVCLDELILKYGFSDKGASNFLKVYDSTIAFAGFANYDKEEGLDEQLGDVDEENNSADDIGEKLPPLPNNKKEKLQMGERELTTGLLSKEAGFRLVVTGKIGAKEIDRLIAKLELDKEILAESDESEDKIVQEED